MIIALYFLPFALCLLYGIQFFFRKKNHTQRYLMYMFLMGAMYFIAYAFYVSPATDYAWLCRLDSISEPLLLITISLFIVYIHMHLGNKDKSSSRKKITEKSMHWFIMPAIAFGAVNFLIYYLVGYEQAAEITKKCDELKAPVTSPVIINMFKGNVEPTILKLYGLFDHTIFTIMAYVYAGILTISCTFCSFKFGYRFGDVFLFFCKRQEAPVERAVSACSLMLIISIAPMLILGRTYFVHHMWTGIAMTMFISISIFFLANVEMMSQKKRFTLKDIVTSSFVDAGISVEQAPKKEKEEEKEKTPEKLSEELLTIRTKHIIEKMQAAFETDHIYKNPELTVGYMAEVVGTNRTTLSNIVNQQYGITFRDLANRYRIDAAKEYITHNPTATQEEIAVACGFRSASALNHKFKEIEGMPPTLWLTTRAAGI